MTDLLLHPAAQSGLAPFAIALIAALLALRFAPRLGQVAVALAFLAAYGIVIGLPAWPPVTATHKLAVAGAGTFVLALLLDLVRVQRPWQAAAAVLVLAGGGAWLALPRLGGWQAWAMLAAVVAGGAFALIRLARQSESGITGGVVLMVAALGLGAVALAGGSASILQLAMALAAGLGGFLVCNWPRQRLALGGAAVLGGGVVLGLLAVQLVFFTRASHSATALLLLVFLADLPLAREDGDGWLRPVAAGAIAAIAAGGAAAVAFIGSGQGVYAG